MVVGRSEFAGHKSEHDGRIGAEQSNIVSLNLRWEDRATWIPVQGLSTGDRDVLPSREDLAVIAENQRKAALAGQRNTDIGKEIHDIIASGTIAKTGKFDPTTTHRILGLFHQNVCSIKNGRDLHSPPEMVSMINAELLDQAKLSGRKSPYILSIKERSGTFFNLQLTEGDPKQPDVRRNLPKDSLLFNTAFSAEATDAIRDQAKKVAKDIKATGNFTDDVVDTAFNLALSKRPRTDSYGEEVALTLVKAINEELSGSGFSIRPLTNKGLTDRQKTDLKPFFDMYPDHEHMLAVALTKPNGKEQLHAHPGVSTPSEKVELDLGNPVLNLIANKGAFVNPGPFSDPNDALARVSQDQAAIKYFGRDSGKADTLEDLQKLLDETNSSLSTAGSEFSLSIAPRGGYNPVQIVIKDNRGQQTGFITLGFYKK
jgi:hypothetical protein